MAHLIPPPPPVFSSVSRSGWVNPFEVTAIPFPVMSPHNKPIRPDRPPVSPTPKISASEKKELVDKDWEAARTLVGFKRQAPVAVDAGAPFWMTNLPTSRQKLPPLSLDVSTMPQLSSTQPTVWQFASDYRSDSVGSMSTQSMPSVDWVEDDEEFVPTRFNKKRRATRQGGRRKKYRRAYGEIILSDDGIVPDRKPNYREYGMHSIAYLKALHKGVRAPWECRICHRVKRTRVELMERHIFCHTEERPLECPFCPDEIKNKNRNRGFFKIAQALIQHVDKQHPENKYDIRARLGVRKREPFSD